MEKVKIAVVDSGIDASFYRDYSDRVVPCLDIDKTQTKDNYCVDVFGHGTQCLDTIRYLSPHSKLYVIKILDHRGKCHSLDLLKALQFCKSLNVDIINLSLSLEEEDEYVEDISTVLNELAEMNITIVASVHNESKMSFPANQPSVVGVKGLLFKDDTFFSVERSITDQDNILLLANKLPILVRSIDNNWGFFSGNSKATAVATAIIAEMLFDNPMLKASRQQIQAALSYRSITANDFVYDLKDFFIRENVDGKEMQFSFEIEPVIFDFMEVFHYEDYDSVFEKRIIDMEIPLYPSMFIELFKRVENREQVKIDYTGFSYKDFEWFWCLLKFINERIKDNEFTLFC